MVHKNYYNHGRLCLQGIQATQVPEQEGRCHRAKFKCRQGPRNYFTQQSGWQGMIKIQGRLRWIRSRCQITLQTIVILMTIFIQKYTSWMILYESPNVVLSQKFMILSLRNMEVSISVTGYQFPIAYIKHLVIGFCLYLSLLL